jgi:nitroreductase
MRTYFKMTFMLCLAAFYCAGFSQELKSIKLPDPQTDGGKPLMQALKERKSQRAFSKEKLSPQTISNLLWAAWGINRPESGGRTAPSARNRQEIEVYVALAEGLFVYVEKSNFLQPVSNQDLRADTGSQGFIKDAPVQLIYVADVSKLGNSSESEQAMTMGEDTGFISQNVYLFCASENLATVVRGMVDRASLGPKMKLRPEQRIVLAQTVGYPAKQP